MKIIIGTNEIFYKQNIGRTFFNVARLISQNLWREMKYKLRNMAGPEVVWP